MDDVTRGGGMPPPPIDRDHREPAGPAVDTARLVRSLDGREGLAKTIASSFVRDTEAQVALLLEALGAGDRVQLTLLAHRFKGNLAILRAERARAVAEDLEETSQEDGNVAGLGGKVENLVAELRAVAVALSAWTAAG
ncbi:MAG: Hpt domain-containing protein [Deltaproteobacteria bacterium]|nr:Hpt domain-containing protein [Deltaproteobacteria bacterium]